MARHSVLHAFYLSKEWKEFRLLLINERGPYCQRCFQPVPNTRELIGHHEIELTVDNVHDYMISLNPAHVKLICHGCHNQLHHRFGSKRYVYLVYGPPFAGKKTFVRQQMMRGDIVVDMDKLYEALSFQPFYDKPDNLYTSVAGVQNYLIDSIATRSGRWGTAWLIGGYPEHFKRQRLADRLGAELIYIEATREECIERMLADQLLVSQRVEWEGYIDKWFGKFSP